MKSTRYLFFLLILVFFLSGGALCSTTKTPTDLGVYKSTDAGENFERKNALPDKKSLEGVSIVEFEIDEFDPNIIYVGLKDYGISKSENGGESWKKTGQTTGSFYGLAIDPKNNRNVYAAGIADNYGKIIKSVDGGEKWSEVYRETHEATKIYGLEIDHFDTRKIYASTEKGAIIKSEDNGRSWVVKHWFNDIVQILRLSPFDSRIIYAGTYQSGVGRSKDGGENWEEVKMPEQSEFNGDKEIFDFRFHPKDPNILFVSSRYGLLKSEDQGNNWKPIQLLVRPGDNSLVRFVIDPKNPDNLFLSLDSSVYKSIDGGAHWTVKKITDNYIYSLALSPENSNIIYAGAWLKPQE